MSRTRPVQRGLVLRADLAPAQSRSLFRRGRTTRTAGSPATVQRRTASAPSARSAVQAVRAVEGHRGTLPSGKRTGRRCRCSWPWFNTVQRVDTCRRRAVSICLDLWRGCRVVELAGIGPGPHDDPRRSGRTSCASNVPTGLGAAPSNDFLLRSRRSVTADLKSESDRDLVLGLIAKADVLIGASARRHRTPGAGTGGLREGQRGADLRPG